MPFFQFLPLTLISCHCLCRRIHSNRTAPNQIPNSEHIQNRNLSTLQLGINFYFISHPSSSSGTSHFPGANFHSVPMLFVQFIAFDFISLLRMAKYGVGLVTMYFMYVEHDAVVSFALYPSFSLSFSFAHISSPDKCNKNFEGPTTKYRKKKRKKNAHTHSMSFDLQ